MFYNSLLTEFNCDCDENMYDLYKVLHNLSETFNCLSVVKI